MTDDDNQYQKEWLLTCKVICIDHYYQIRQQQVSIHVGTRPFKREIPYALQSYHIVNIRDKINSIRSNINVCVIGGQIGGLENIIIKNSNEITFQCFTRKLSVNHFGIISSNNIKYYIEASTFVMMEGLRQSQYVFMYGS